MSMRKMIIASLFTGTVILTVIMAFFFHKTLYNYRESAEMEHLENTIRELIRTVEVNEVRENRAYGFFSEDYRNRANIAAYLYDEEKEGEVDWERMLELLDVAAVDVVDSRGIITDSSNPKNLGINFYETEALREFLPLIEGKYRTRTYIQKNGTSLETEKRMIFIGANRRDTPYGMILIEEFPIALERYEDLTNIKNIIKAVPTENHRIMFALDQSTGDFLAFSGSDSPKNFSVKRIKDMREGELRSGRDCSEKDGGEWLTTLACRKGIVYGYASNPDVIRTEVFNSFYIVLAVIVVMNLLIQFLVYRMLGYVVLKDLDAICKKIELFVEGHTVQFSGGKSKEMQKLFRNINHLTESIESRQTRLSAMTEMFGEGMAAYEYYKDLNQIYCSSNLSAMMELSEEEIREKIKEADQSVKKEWIDPEKGFYQEERYETKSGRLLSIRMICMYTFLYAFVQDVTEAAEKVQKLQDKLDEERDRSMRDHLTGLFNRNKLELEAEKVFRQSDPEGMLLLLDLDNFKRVNDGAGHMEGDIVLKKFSRILENQFRTTDTVARLGGDEFAVFLKRTLPEDVFCKKTKRLMDRVRMELQEYYEQYQLSVSIGAASITPEISSIEKLYQCADSAMYVVKRLGKNGFYFNRENNTCMREHCINCRENCDRRDVLYGENKAGVNTF